jgi:hypothetical protein
MSSGVRSDATLPIESTHQALASPTHISVPIASARSDICQTSFGFFGQNLSDSDSFFLRVEARSLDLLTVGLEHDEIGSAFRLNQDVHNAFVQWHEDSPGLSISITRLGQKRKTVIHVTPA